ncbi:MAG: hypothetical protein ACLT3H_05930 [Roseburia sp.]
MKRTLIIFTACLLLIAASISNVGTLANLDSNIASCFFFPDLLECY